MAKKKKKEPIFYFSGGDDCIQEILKRQTGQVPNCGVLLSYYAFRKKKNVKEHIKKILGGKK